ncbi:MAG: hypothetical protein SPJ42_06590 [Oscillospiraceae bacterium]|nr:hypothetical protein [Oscillospiraceae bacterium]
MPFINSGIYIDTSVKEKSYEIETSYYLEFQIKSALISIDKLRCFSENSFDNKYQYYHFYTDHLLYSLGQIANRFIVNDKDNGVVLERKKANCRDFEFNAEKYPNLSDKTGRNTIEHIDEHNQKIIEKRKGVGGFNLIDNETETDLINVFKSQRQFHPYTLDLIAFEILIFRNEKEIDISILELEKELKCLYNRVQYVIEHVRPIF